MINKYFDSLVRWNSYDRPYLAKLWGYKGYQGISRGVVTPKGEKFIILFVTKDKQNSMTQYNDYIKDYILYWEGEEKHKSDERIINAATTGNKIYLFYREIHHMPFVYFGEVFLIDYIFEPNKSSSFKFALEDKNKNEEENEIKKIKENKNISETEKVTLIKSRIGQGKYRNDLIKIWKGCSVTEVKSTNLLKASHIKPWVKSNNQERLDVNNGLLLTPALDHTFDSGLISFDVDGKIIISEELSREEADIMNINRGMNLKKTSKKIAEYLEYHRKNIFKGKL